MTLGVLGKHTLVFFTRIQCLASDMLVNILPKTHRTDSETMGYLAVHVTDTQVQKKLSFLLLCVFYFPITCLTLSGKIIHPLQTTNISISYSFHELVGTRKSTNFPATEESCPDQLGLFHTDDF